MCVLAELVCLFLRLLVCHFKCWKSPGAFSSSSLCIQSRKERSLGKALLLSVWMMCRSTLICCWVQQTNVCTCLCEWRKSIKLFNSTLWTSLSVEGISVCVCLCRQAGCLIPVRLRLFLKSLLSLWGKKIIWGQTNFLPAVSNWECVCRSVGKATYMNSFKRMCVCFAGVCASKRVCLCWLIGLISPLKE